LTPASGCRDHTAWPSASSSFVHAPRRAWAETSIASRTRHSWRSR